MVPRELVVTQAVQQGKVDRQYRDCAEDVPRPVQRQEHRGQSVDVVNLDAGGVEIDGQYAVTGAGEPLRQVGAEPAQPEQDDIGVVVPAVGLARPDIPSFEYREPPLHPAVELVGVEDHVGRTADGDQADHGDEADRGAGGVSQAQPQWPPG